LPFQAREVAFKLNLKDGQVNQFVKVMSAAYQAFIENDFALFEINPLSVRENGDILCVDAKVGIDSNALYRLPEIAALRDKSQENERELKASEFDLNYVALEGNIGCMVNGAGLAMATMDIIKLYGGQPANFLEVGIEHTALATQGFSLRGGTALGFFKQVCEYLAAAAHGGKAHTIGGPRKGILTRVMGGGNFQGMKACLLRGYLGNFLIHRDGVAIRGAKLAACEPDFLAVVMVTQAARVVHAADGGDELAVLFEGAEGFGKLVILALGGDLVIQRVHTVGYVDENAAPWGCGFGRQIRYHAIQPGKCDAGAHGA